MNVLLSSGKCPDLFKLHGSFLAGSLNISTAFPLFFFFCKLDGVLSDYIYPGLFLSSAEDLRSKLQSLSSHFGRLSDEVFSQCLSKPHNDDSR